MTAAPIVAHETVAHEQAAAAIERGPIVVPDAYAWRKRIPRTASTSRRFLAFAADAAIVFLLAWMATFTAAALGVLRIPRVDLFGAPNDWYALFWLVGIFELPILLAYFTIIEARAGRTPGKILVGLRVEREDGAPITLSDSFLRNLLRLLWVTPLAPAFLALDLWALQSTELDQRMGDLAAGTVVVDDRVTFDA